MPIAENAGIRIYYRTEGEGPPLVLHHWSFATLDNWVDFGYVSALKDAFRLILLDARGHGLSDKPHNPDAYTPEMRVGDILAVLDDLNIAKAHFFGYSMGGWVGFCVARYAPERFHSLIIGGQHPLAQNLEGLRDMVRYGIENGGQAFTAMWEENFGLLPAKSREQMLASDFEALLAVSHDRESLEDVLPAIKMPCLLFCGENDGVRVLAEESSGKIANSTFVTIAGLDHGETIKRSDLVVPMLMNFLKITES